LRKEVFVSCFIEGVEMYQIDSQFVDMWWTRRGALGKP